MNTIGKTLYILSCFSPVLFFWGLKIALDDGEKSPAAWVAYLLISASILLVLLAWFLWIPICNQPTDSYKIAKIKFADKDLIAFIIAYLSPLIKDTLIVGDLIVAGSVSVFILAFMIRSNSPPFNPVFALLGYKFYEIESNSVAYLYLSRSELTDSGVSVLAKMPFVGMLIEAPAPKRNRDEPASKSRSQSIGKSRDRKRVEKIAAK